MDGLFRYQYVISQTPRPDLGKTSARLNQSHLYLGTALPRARLRNKSGEIFGHLFGIAVDADGRLVEEDFGNAPDPAHAGWLAVEDWIVNLTGRWGVLLTDGSSTRFYTDACGMIGAVYDQHSRTVAATLAKCLNRSILDHPDYDHEAISQRGAKYTLFDTRDAHARRMNPSCRLELETFTETRFWPRSDSIRLHENNLGTTYDWLAARTRNVIAAISSRHRCWLPLSGGQDSRLILAMAADSAKAIERSFTHISNYANRIDAAIAARMAKVADLPHEIHDRREHRTNRRRARVDAENFSTAIGFPMPASTEMKNGLHLKVPRNVVILRGHQTDMMRAVFSDRIGEAARRNTRWQIKRLMAVPYHEFDNITWERFRPRYEAWLSALPAHARKNSTDLMFLEIYYSSSIGCTFPANHRNFPLSPFNGRAQIAYTMAVDETYRRRSHAVHDLVHRTNPALHDIPYDFELKAEIAHLNDLQTMKALTKIRRDATRARAANEFNIAEKL